MADPNPVPPVPIDPAAPVAPVIAAPPIDAVQAAIGKVDAIDQAISDAKTKLAQLVRDRSLRFAVGLTVAVAIPVAILFYFQFRSLADLGQSSTVVLRQLSQETADAVTKDLQDALRAPRVDVLLKIGQRQTEPLDLPFIENTFEQGLAAGIVPHERHGNLARAKRVFHDRLHELLPIRRRPRE